MKLFLPVAIVAALLSAGLHAQDAPAKPSQPGLPPPALHDPGVRGAPATAAPQREPKAESTPAELTPTRLPGKPIPLPRQPGDNAPSEAIPDVRVHQEGDQTVQEYRRSGRLYMVVVTPKNGVPQTYMVDAQGTLRNENGQPPVRPVMYKIMEWGKSPPPADADGSGAAADSH
ncbi:DUF2782 domain-containing protein [Dyella sp.]|jgi:hypothetical protein|uniref:DUF2782 domain-containing protein n=1 Tax=Dyella sp. TaxID=1869338 RepID=UPI002D780E65|nr:DUF2782 domain-containing protein [Dyella sp.]HET6431430.1 DUF2782 domain-containing protein [Dyella sp.]